MGWSVVFDVGGEVEPVCLEGFASRQDAERAARRAMTRGLAVAESEGSRIFAPSRVGEAVIGLDEKARGRRGVELDEAGEASRPSWWARLLTGA